MSTRALVRTQAVQSILKPTPFGILARLAWHRNPKTGLCCPSEETLASECNCSRRTVIRALKTLVDEGFVTVTLVRGRGRFRHNSYSLSYDSVETTETALPAASVIQTTACSPQTIGNAPGSSYVPSVTIVDDRVAENPFATADAADFITAGDDPCPSTECHDVTLNRKVPGYNNLVLESDMAAERENKDTSLPQTPSLAKNIHHTGAYRAHGRDIQKVPPEPPSADADPTVSFWTMPEEKLLEHRATEVLLTCLGNGCWLKFTLATSDATVISQFAAIREQILSRIGTSGEIRNPAAWFTHYFGYIFADELSDSSHKPSDSSGFPTVRKNI